MFDSLDDARRKPALWRYDCNNLGPRSSPKNKALAALAQNETEEYENQTRKLS